MSPDPLTGSLLTHLECPRCGAMESPDARATHCACPGPWFPRYDLDADAGRRIRDAVRDRPTGLWRFSEVLPVRSREHVVSLGEGATPVLAAPRLGAHFGMERVSVKDESHNPTASFKARGLSVAVSRARELGVRAVAAPSAGNAGLAMAAYAARAGLSCHVAYPSGTPDPYFRLSRLLGANVLEADGTISDAGRVLEANLRERGATEDVFRLATLKEPYRLEGKKTMAYELAPPWGPGLPDVVLYPTGGGTGLVGMWKAFDEMERLGWIGAGRPKMVSVQLDSCAPVVEAWRRDLPSIPQDLPEPPPTRAHGLRVPHPFADREILTVVRASEGAAVAVSEDEIRDAERLLAEKEGLLPAPESAATAAAIPKLMDMGMLRPSTRVLLLLTGGAALYG